jgi:hypothetical protein
MKRLLNTLYPTLQINNYKQRAIIKDVVKITWQCKTTRLWTCYYKLWTLYENGRTVELFMDANILSKQIYNYDKYMSVLC